MEVCRRPPMWRPLRSPSSSKRVFPYSPLPERTQARRKHYEWMSIPHPAKRKRMDIGMSDVIDKSSMKTEQAKRQTIMLIDGHAMIHRAFHAFPEDWTTSKGEVVNATFGVTTI